MLTDTTLAERFWAKVNTSGDCWLWTAAQRDYGAGIIHLIEDGKYRQTTAHRASWALHNGPVPAGKRVAQTCGNPLCVNPAHLKLLESRLTAMHRQFIGVELPDDPPGCSRRDWTMFTGHVRGYQSYEELAVEYRMHVRSVLEIVDRVATFVEKPPEHPPRRYRTPELREQPAGVSHRDWSIYCRYIYDQETLNTIAPDYGISRGKGAADCECRGDPRTLDLTLTTYNTVFVAVKALWVGLKHQEALAWNVAAIQGRQT